ncbi:MAG: hypothetical protein JWO41_48 [Candidatus Saccharibacteria bacterium]|nr:hypothetical protein [Candidatus Saccharibacteria bacterium]
MIQFNLLPDVKIDYIKAQQTRRTMLSAATIVTVISVGIFILSFGANQLQKKHLNDLNTDIKRETSQLKGNPDIDKVLTIQNQLQSLTALHDAKPAVTRVFSYLNQVTPNNTTISSMTLDLVTHSFSLTGSSDTLSSVNKYIDTLKFTTYKSDTVTDATPAFTGVVLSSFGLTPADNGKPSTSSYTISFSYDPNIFDIKQTVKLAIPSTVSTRSEVDKPTELFTKAPATTTQGGK